MVTTITSALAQVKDDLPRMIEHHVVEKKRNYESRVSR